MARPPKSGQSGGIQSLDSALELLKALALHRGPASLTELSRDCSMQPSKAHRYLASFQRAGLVEQISRSGKYDLGPAAMQLGLAAIDRHDFVNRATEGLPELCAATGMTALISVWANNGATVVRWERAISPTVTSMGLGTTLPLLNSATGRAFLAWAPPAPIKAARDGELRKAKLNPALIPDITPSVRGLTDLVETVREKGYATISGEFIPGLVAIAAPILDWQNEAQAVVTLIGVDPATIQPKSPQVAALIAYCRNHSVLLPDRPAR